MFEPNEYELVDFGDGRKLERFGPYLLDRQSPVADRMPRGEPQAWLRATARYERTSGDRGVWLSTSGQPGLPPRWTIHSGALAFELKATEFGHVGVFPEQAENWKWLGQQVARTGRRLKVLNLFAYTGASTLAAAAAGAEVVHVDAARNTITWARRNAELSGLAAAPIRWIHEDAARFVARELKRGNGYDAVILDPPSYGHGPNGEAWKASEQMPRLIADCARLTAGRRCFMLVTCHTPGIGPTELRSLLSDSIGSAEVESGTMDLATSAGRILPSGVTARTK
jgi:23S rRNA (cytosine1962-C5)-methyltransferase